MGLIWCDGFDAADKNGLSTAYALGDAAGFTHINTIAPRSGGQCVSVSSYGITKVFSARTALVMGMACYERFTFNAYAPGGGSPLWRLQFDSLGMLSLVIDPDNHRAGHATVTSTRPLFQGLTWKYYEVKWSHADGSITVRCNGETVISTTGAILGANTQAVDFGGDGLDDFYLLDAGDGNAPNDFLGDVQVVTLPVVAPGRVTGWVPTGAASNEAAVAGIPEDTTSYVSSAAVGTVDAYALGPLPVGVTQVFAVQLQAYTQKDDAGSRWIGLGFGDGATENFDDASGVSVSDTWAYQTRALNQNPLTLAPWEASDLATAQVAVKVQA